MFLGGTYTDTYFVGDDGFWPDYRQFYVHSVNGTEDLPIWLVAYPGLTRPSFSPTNVAPKSIAPVIFASSSNWIVRGIESSGGYGSGINLSGGSNNIDIADVYVHDRPGLGGYGNHGCVTFSQGGIGNNLRYSTLDNCNNPDNPTNYNNSLIVIFDQRATDISYNNLINTASARVSSGIKDKHAYYSPTDIAKGNYISGVETAFVLGGGRGWNITNNLVVSVNSGLQLSDCGGSNYYGNMTFENNTIIFDNIGMTIKPEWGYNADATPAANNLSGLPNPPEASTVRKNVFVGLMTSLNDNYHMWNIFMYGRPAIYDRIFSGRLWVPSNNSYYAKRLGGAPSGSFKVFSYCDSCGRVKPKGSDYSLFGLKSDASYLEVGSSAEDPELDSMSVVRNSSLSSWGYMPLSSVSAENILPPSELKGTVVH